MHYLTSTYFYLGIGVGMGGARWAIAHPLLKVGGPGLWLWPTHFS